MKIRIIRLLISAVLYIASYIIFFYSDFPFSITNLADNNNIQSSGLLIPYSFETVWEYFHHSGIPDLHFYYSADWLNNNIVLFNLPAYKLVLYGDFVYPIIYSSFFFSLISLLSGKTGNRETSLSAVPFAAAFFDYVENFFLLYIINFYSSNPVFFISYAGYITLAKHILLSISVLLVLLYLLRLMLVNKKG